jgi:hypothetical protein
MVSRGEAEAGGSDLAAFVQYVGGRGLGEDISGGVIEAGYQTIIPASL